MRFLIPITILMAAVMAACTAAAQSTSLEEEATATPTPSPSPTPTPEPASYFDDTITLELKAPSELYQGQRLEGLDVVMTNTGAMPFKFYYSGNLLDFEVLDAEGDLLWRHLHAYVMPLGTEILAPGESKTLSEMGWSSQGQWDLRDRQGFPVEPGQYQVRGVVTFHLQDPAEDRDEERLETASHTLMVHEAPLPDYAQPIELELTAPSEAQSGEPVPMDMHITNTGDDTLVLWWSGDRVIPRPNYIDIVIFQDGEPIWRATSAHGVEYSGTMTLGPGESLTMSGVSFDTIRSRYESTGEPWEWKQRADCGEYRFEPCEEPVEPGTYIVRGVVNVSPPETMEQEPPFTPERAAVATEPHELVITP